MRLLPVTVPLLLLFVTCTVSADDRPAWRGPHGGDDKKMYGGPSATPTIDAATAYIYTQSIDGLLQCRDRDGNLVVLQLRKD